MSVSDDALNAAARTIRSGELVVYPTETVYGLGADALDADAIGRVFSVKQRPRTNPLSLGVPDIETAFEYTHPGERTRRFMHAFLPGPITVVCQKDPRVPGELTGGRDRVGVRIPDHDVALGLLSRVAPLTATSANRSGMGSVTRLDQLDLSVREAAAVVLDGGETPGTESTVVDPERGVIHRPGALVEEVRDWLTTT